MSIIIKLQGLPLEATSVDVRRYFLGLTIPDGGVHIVGGDEGTVFIEFASDEDARQAMARGDGTIRNSTIKLLLSSRTEMQSVIEAARQQQQQYLQQFLQLPPSTIAQPLQQPPQPQPQQQQQPQQPSPFIDPRILSQNYQSIMQPALNQPAALLPQQQSQIFNQFTPTTIATSNSGGLNLGLLGSVGGLVGGGGGAVPGGVVTSVASCTGDLNLNAALLAANVAGVVTTAAGTIPSSGMNQVVGNLMIPNNLMSGNGGGLVGSMNSNNGNTNLAISNSNQNHSPDNRARMSGMRGGDDKLFANKRCVLAASNIPYRATSKDIIEFLSEFNIKEDCIRRRYNQKGQPTADAKIAFPTPDAAMKAMKMMNKKQLCGRPVFLKPV